MGLFDKLAKSVKSVASGFGEETVGRSSSTPEASEPKNRASRRSNDEPKPAVREKPSRSRSDEDSFLDSSFEMPDDHAEMMESSRLAHESQMKQYEGIPDPTVQNNRFTDVLDLLQIEETFEVPNDLFIPGQDEILDAPNFPIQVPQGYDIGQVDAFVARARDTIKFMFDKLLVRNADVMTLAAVVDRAQVNSHNLQVQAEISSGINVMPTSEYDDVNSQLQALRIECRRLESENEQLRAGLGGEDSPYVMTEEDQNRFDELSDRASVAERDAETLREENARLRTRIDFMLEQGSDLGDGSDELEDPNMDDSDVLSGYSTDVDADDSLDDLDLPSDLNGGTSTHGHIRDIPLSSAFAQDDESMDDFLKNNEKYYNGDEDSDDDLSDYFAPEKKTHRDSDHLSTDDGGFDMEAWMRKEEQQ